MTALFSLWPGTPKFSLRREEALVATLALCKASTHMDAELHTDEFGGAIAHELGWNKALPRTYLTLSSLETFAPLESWSYGKLYALSRVNRPAVHVDLDVILHKPLPERLLKGSLIAQSIDLPDHYRSDDIAVCIETCGLTYNGRAYNAGLLGGSDVHHVQAYAQFGMDVAECFRGSGLDPTACSMVSEQFALGYYCELNKVKVETLFHGLPTPKQATEFGYTHLIGKAKRNPLYVSGVERILGQEFPEALERLNAGWAVLDSAIHSFA